MKLFFSNAVFHINSIYIARSITTNMAKKLFILSYLTLLFMAAQAQNRVASTINWNQNTDGTLSFSEQNSCSNQCRLPALVLKYDGSIYGEATCTFEDLKELTPQETLYIKNAGIKPFNATESHTTMVEKQPVLEITLTPLLFDSLDGRYKKAGRYTIELIRKPAMTKSTATSTATFKNESILKSGKWVRIRVQSTGIHRINYSTLKQWGFSNPSLVAIYGNGGKMLPYQNNAYRPDDLSPCAIEHRNNSILFYAQGADQYKYNENTELFDYSAHDYETYAYYFLTEQATTNTPAEKNNQQLAPSTTITSFNDRAHYESNQYNLIRSGKQWLGERFDSNTQQRTFNFSFPQLDPSKTTTITVAAVARSGASTQFNIKANNQAAGDININAVQMNSEESLFAAEGQSTKKLAIAQQDISVALSFNPGSTSALGWLDYITVNTFSKIRLTESQLQFRSTETLKAQTAAKFIIENANENTIVWDVTTPWSPERILGELSQGSYSFNVPTGSLREFVAFNQNGTFPEPELQETVSNQNLHALQPVNFIILTHPDFLVQAQTLAQTHIEAQNISVAIVTPQQIYNEFSSGSRDITAIRDFLRMLYQRSEPTDPNRLRYLLLLGDGSYNNKANDAENPNFIPTYQSENSLHQSETYVSDDFYGFLDDEEGLYDAMDRLDIGIGRFPVQTAKQAAQAVEKSIRHLTASATGNWKKSLTFVGDDGDSNIHMLQSNDLTKKLAQTNPEFDITKIFLDAYIPTISSSGKTYPDANTDINRAINEGTLIFNYTGHGGGRGLSHESVVNLNTIQSWNNANKLALFVTATCQFTRYDDKSETSAGELVFLNPQGGAIALFSTTRIAYSHNNETINKTLYEHAFQKDSKGNKYAMGEIIQRTKNGTGTNTYKMNFTLIGDPALPLLHPENKVATDSINAIALEQYTDTLTAMSTNTISGTIRDNQGNILENFNGMVAITIFDKPISVNTRGNEGAPFTYSTYQSIIFKGSTQVVNGRFKVAFIVPKDIRYNIGTGRISYYAWDEINKTEAIGANNNLLIGGASKTPVNDTSGPEVTIWLNNQSFKNGQKVGSSPLLIAQLSDVSGINTTGIGVGHDITLFVDGNRSNPIILNNYYETAAINYTNGSIHYQLNGLTPGQHTLELRAWDNMNNSSIAKIDFEVVDRMGLTITAPVVYPNPCTINQSDLKLKFDLDEYNAILEVEISIYSQMGQLVGQQQESIKTAGNTVNPIVVTTQGIKPGLYLVDVKISSANGREGTFSKKIMFIQ